MKTQVTQDGYTLSMEREMIDVSSRGHHELDPEWSYTDPSGHVHTSLDTLTWVVTGTYWCDMCRDEHDEGEYRCTECAAVVEPRFVWIDTSMQRQYLPGLEHVRLEFDDGRVYAVRPAELPVVFNGDGRVDADWIARVTSRDPDAWGAR